MKIIILATLLALSGCGKTDASHLKHDTENPVVDGERAFWSTETDEDYLSAVQATTWGAYDPALDSTNYLPATHPMTMRLQYWLSRIDTMLRQRYPAMLDHVPPPRVAVLKTDDVNAYVGSMPVCFDNVVVRFGDSPAEAVVDRGATYSEGRIIDPRDGLKRLVCRHQTVTFTELLTEVNHYNNSDHICKLQPVKLDDDKFEVKPGPGCLIDPTLAALGAVSTYVAMTTAQHVTVFSGILRSMPEEQIVAVLAHELGHYYHGHVVSPQGRYGYFFHLTVDNPSTQPIEASELVGLNADFNATRNELAEVEMDVASLVNSMPRGIFPKIAGQQFHTALYKPLQSLITRALIVSNCTADVNCACAKASASGLVRFKASEEGISGPITSDEEAAYLQFEANALACLAPYNIASNPVTMGDDGKATLLAKDVFASIMDRGFGLAGQDLRLVVPQGSVVEYIKTATATLDAQYPVLSSTDLSQLVSKKEKLANSRGRRNLIQEKMDKFDADAKQQLIGYYTYEEEADELSAEWLSYLGFSPRVGGDSDMAYVKTFGTPEEAAKCSEARDANWKAADGTDIILPWGSLGDPHPADCFRVRNYDKESLAHQYPTPADSPTASLQPAWSELVETLEDQPSQAGANEVTASHAASNHLRCRFAPR